MASRTALATLVALLVACAAPVAAQAGGWEWPVRGEVITPYRNGDDPYAGGRHRGIDIATAAGSRVVAATAGSVRFAGVAGSSGLTVSVRTADGRFDTSYLHLSSATVKEGETVGTGDPIGAVGTSGRRSAAQPHLHFGVREAGTRHSYRDPMDFLAPPAAPVRDAPRGAPAPIGVPVRVAPVPEPVRRGAPVRAPRRVPAGRRVPVPAPRPRPFPRGLRRPVPGAPLARPHPVGVRARPARSPLGDRAPGSAPDPLPHAAPVGAERPRAPAPAGDQPTGGPDLGWALACTGLLLAAACLGVRRDGSTPRARPSLRTALRPLTGKR